MSKRALIVLLAGANVILLAFLLGSVMELPSAYAQPSPYDAQFLTVTAKSSGQAFDVLYMLDLGQGQPRLHAFYPSPRHTRRLAYAGFRDLEKDFGTQRSNP